MSDRFPLTLSEAVYLAGLRAQSVLGQFNDKIDLVDYGSATHIHTHTHIHTRASYIYTATFKFRKLDPIINILPECSSNITHL